MNTNNYNYFASANLLVLQNKNEEFVERYETFKKIFNAFREANVKWELTCSMSLFLLGIVDNFHDFDILVSPESCDAAVNALCKIGNQIRVGQRDECKHIFNSDYYSEFKVDGIGVDLICEYGFTTFGTSYKYHFNNAETIYVNVADMEIPIVIPEAQYLDDGMATSKRN